MANTVSIAALRPELWQRELFKDVMDDLYFQRNGLMGEGENNIIQVKNNLKKSNGDTVTFGLTTKLSGNGVTGDSELEGNEEAILSYSQSVAINQLRNSVRLTGKLDEQMAAYDMRMDAKSKLAAWAKETLERQFFMKLGGVTTTTLTDVNSAVYSGLATFSNSPNVVPAADEAAGSGSRYVCACATGVDAIATTDILTPALISRAKHKAKLASPKIRPLRVEGKDYYVIFIHPSQAYDLKNAASGVWAQANREAQVRGDSNPLFTGALGIWDGVIIYEHEYVPTAQATAAFSVGGTGCLARTFRALLCGQQAGVFAQTQDSFTMVEKLFDYDNKVGYATGFIGGIQKAAFNSLDYGVISVDTGATAL